MIDAARVGSPVPVSPPVESQVPAAPVSAAPARLGTFHSLRDPAFAWFFISTLGMMGAVMMQMLVRGFLVFELTGSFTALGLLSLASALPQLVFGFYGGVLADRFPKKIVTQVGQVIGCANVLGMGLLASFGLLEFWHLLASGVGSGLLVGMMMPARQAMVYEVVKGERMMNAISLNSAGMNMMQITAPAVGGLVLRAWGADGAFFVMAASYAVAILTMSLVPGAPATQRSAATASGAVREVLDGLRYVGNHRELRQILVFSFFVALLGSAYMPVLPGFVLRRVLRRFVRSRSSHRRERRRLPRGIVGSCYVARQLSRAASDRERHRAWPWTDRALFQSLRSGCDPVHGDHRNRPSGTAERRQHSASCLRGRFVSWTCDVPLHVAVRGYVVRRVRYRRSGQPNQHRAGIRDRRNRPRCGWSRDRIDVAHAADD